jgi:hypothetical protein
MARLEDSIELKTALEGLDYARDVQRRGKSSPARTLQVLLNLN